MKLKFSISILIAAFAVMLLLKTSLSFAEPVSYTPPPETAHFKPAPEAMRAITYCSMCHSADYVSTQPPLPRDKWKGIVVKMQKVHGALIPDTEIDGIVEYLVKNYGAEK